MRIYLLCHTHEAHECPVAFAAWSGFDSPLRQQPVLASCELGGHALWWTVRAVDEVEAVAQLPRYVATRTAVVEVKEVLVP